MRWLHLLYCWISVGYAYPEKATVPAVCLGTVARTGENVEEAFLQTAYKIYENIEKGVYVINVG